MLQIIKLKLASVISFVTLSLLEWKSTLQVAGTKIIGDPDPNKIFTKRKARECPISLDDSSTQIKNVSKVHYPTTNTHCLRAKQQKI